MNRKELVEELRLTNEEILGACRLAWDDAMGHPFPEDPTFIKYELAHSMLLAQLNKVLNDPDLAWIDREQSEDDSVMWNPYNKVVQSHRNGTIYYPTIPLTELKETPND